uniref:Uncharacterized protein n=1 Tax=Leersia perrieri TaxID=77586 RepID=A0A0D9WSF6_9ORYZ
MKIWPFRWFKSIKHSNQCLETKLKDFMMKPSCVRGHTVGASFVTTLLFCENHMQLGQTLVDTKLQEIGISGSCPNATG